MSVVIDGTSGITTPAETVNGPVTVTGLITGATNYTGFKSRIINGNMAIDQRNAGASVTPISGQFLVDRFFVGLTQASKFSVQRNAGAVTPPAGFSSYLGVTSLSSYSVLTADYFYVAQSVEGFNVADFSWGTANAQTATLSFKVYSSLTGTFGGSIRNSAGTRSYPFTYTISSANTWTTISVTIAGDTTGTWLTTTGIGLVVFFGLGAGSTYSNTAGAWAAGNYVSATGATSVVGTNGATFYITGVQLEKGSTATSFDYRPYGTELALCQRYYNEITSSTGGGYINGVSSGIAWGTTTWSGGQLVFPVEMRSSPTLTKLGSTPRLYSPNLGGFTCTIVFDNATTKSASFLGTGATGLTIGSAYYIAATTTSISILSFSAEL